MRGTGGLQVDERCMRYAMIVFHVQGTHEMINAMQGTHEMQDAKDQWSNTITVKNLKPQLAHLVERPKRR